MNVCCMALDELREWVKNKPEKGDVAYCKNHHDEHEYMYVYRGPDPNPTWVRQEDLVNKCLEEINKLKIEDITVNKRCDNCKHFGSYTYKDGIGGSWCNHEKHKGMLVPNFTSCPEHEPKEKKSTPFDGMKLYLKDQTTGELAIDYICEDCGKLMKEAPDHWWVVLPINNSRDKNKSPRRPGYHFRCSECEKKLEGKR